MEIESKIRHLLDAVSQYTSIPVNELSSKKRHRPIVNARIMYAGLCVDFIKGITLHQLSFPLKRGHDMAIFYKRRHHDLVDIDKEYKKTYTNLYNIVEEDVSKRFTITDVKYKNKMRQAHYETQLNVEKMNNLYYSAVEVLRSTLKEIEEDYCMSLEGFRKERIRVDIQKRISELRKIKMS